MPEASLLNACRAQGMYADCYAVDVQSVVSHEQFVAAFYTTFVFGIERAILKWVVAKPSTDQEVRDLAAGASDRFAAWTVEKRVVNQLLLADYQGKTKSWLMVLPFNSERGPATRLYFGTAIVPATDRRTGKVAMSLGFRWLLGFHKVYSEVLLRAAASRLQV
jgi:hypothetical protein